MTWPELVARELARREQELPPPPLDVEPMCAAVCGRWGCVLTPVGLFCLSCWFRICSPRSAS